MFSFWFQFGFFADISEVLCRIFNSKKFIHSIQHNSPGWTLYMGKFLERWIFGIGHLQHQIPYLEWVTFPRVGDVNISPGWVSSTSDQSQEWRSSTSESQRWVSPTADSPVWVSPKSDSLGWLSSTLDFLGWVSSTSVTCSRAASVSYPSVSSS